MWWDLLIGTAAALLLAYLAVPIDLVPDFVPVLGYADDAIIVTAVLRGVVRAHWPGTTTASPPSPASPAWTAHHGRPKGFGKVT